MLTSKVDHRRAPLYCVLVPGVATRLLREPFEAEWGADCWHGPSELDQPIGSRPEEPVQVRCRPALPVFDWLLLADPPSGVCQVSRFLSLWLARKEGVADHKALVLLGHPLWRAVELYQRILNQPGAPLHLLASQHPIGAFYGLEETQKLCNRQCRFFAPSDPLWASAESPSSSDEGLDTLASRAIAEVEALSLWVGLEDRLQADRHGLNRVLADNGYDLSLARLASASPPSRLADLTDEDVLAISRAQAADIALCRHFRRRLEADEKKRADALA